MSAQQAYTDQQKAAILRRGTSIGLSAGAGCGKTFVLTERFMTFLKPEAAGGDHDPLSRVVAITFTERAAREMRDRIRGACMRMLATCTEADAPHWLGILRRIDTARISTIHAFCATFLRRHAVQAGIDPHFTLLDQALGQTLLRRTVQTTLRRLLADRDPGASLLVLRYGADKAATHLETLLRAVSINVWEQLQTEPEQIVVQWRKHLEIVVLPRLFRDFIESPATRQALLLLQANEPQHQTMQQRRSFVIDCLTGLRDKKTECSFETLMQLREQAQIKSAGSKSQWTSEDIHEQVRDALKALRKEIDDLKKFDPSALKAADLYAAAEVTAAAFRVLTEVAADYRRAKEESALLDFDDLLSRARDLLRDSNEARAEAVKTIDTLLVDEFQDTDPVQADIVEMLVGSIAESGKLFVVGDAKQSIYRFRRADPAVFDAVRARIPEPGRLPLSINFRSQPAILKFVNALFGPAFGKSYEPLTPDRPQLSPEPSVEFLFAPPDPNSPNRDNADARRRREGEWIARRIAELLADETPRVLEKNVETDRHELRRVRPGDITILFRSLPNVGLYEEALRRHGIEYYLVGGRVFFAQQEVYDLVNLCSYLADPGDVVSLIGVLRSPFFGLSDDTIVALALGKSLPESLGKEPPGDLPEPQREQVRHAARVLGDLVAKKDRSPLATLLQEAIDRTGYDASLLHEFLGSRKVANLRKLIDLARQFDRAEMGTLSEFVTRLRESIAEETVEELAATNPESGDVVRMMTIHQAKGLEFPVVIVADVDRKPPGIQDEAVFDRQLGPLLAAPKLGRTEAEHAAMMMFRTIESIEDEQESLRVFYVAVTRAADHLILSSGIDPAANSRSPWMKLLMSRFNLGTGLPVVDPYLGRFAGVCDSAQIPNIRVHLSQPAGGGTAAARLHRTKLAEYRDRVHAAEPADLPRLMGPTPPACGSPPVISVSMIERADEAATSAEPISAQSAIKLDADTELLDTDEATQLGSAVHAVLERIDGRDQPQIESWVQHAVGRLVRGDGGKKILAAVRKRVDAFLASPVHREIAAAERCFREVEFVLPWPAGNRSNGQRTLALITGKIDCLIQARDGRWKVIDYKTGKLPASDPVAFIEHYAIQMAIYALAVRELVGVFPDAIELVALQQQVTRVPLAVSPEFLARIETRIDAAIGMLLAAPV